MPDLAALANDVKGMPDQALQSELSNPTGLIPGYLVLAEAQRRQITRQAAQNQQQGQSSSVYDDVVRNMMARQPPQGLPPAPAGMTPAPSTPPQPGATPPNNFAAPPPQAMADGGPFTDDGADDGADDRDSEPPPLDPLISNLGQAIYRMEGSRAGMLSDRNNNPGNLRPGVGKPGTDRNGFAIYPDLEAGWNALHDQIQKNVDRGLTLKEFFAGKPGVYAGYAPASDKNDPEGYAANVAQWTGINPDVPLKQQLQGTAAQATAANTAQPAVDQTQAAAAPAATTAPPATTASLAAQLEKMQEPAEMKTAPPASPLTADQTSSSGSDYIRQMLQSAETQKATIRQLQTQLLNRYNNPSPWEYLGNVAMGMNKSGSVLLPAMLAEGVGRANQERNAEQQKMLGDIVALGGEADKIDSGFLRAQMLRPQTEKGLQRIDPTTGQPYEGSWTRTQQLNPLTGQLEVTWLPEAVKTNRIARGSMASAESIATMIQNGHRIYMQDSDKPLTLQDLTALNNPYYDTWVQAGRISITPAAPTMMTKSLNGVTYQIDPRSGKFLRALGPTATTRTQKRAVLVPDPGSPTGWSSQTFETVSEPFAGGVPGAPSLPATTAPATTAPATVAPPATGAPAAAAGTPAAPVLPAAPAAAAQPQAPQPGVIGPHGGPPMPSLADVRKQQIVAQTYTPVTEAATQIFGDPTHPDFKSLIDYAPYADNPEFRKHVGDALRFTFRGMEDATGGASIAAGAGPIHVSTGGIGTLLENYFNVPKKIADQQQRMIQESVSKLSPTERDAYYRTLNSYATIVGMRSLTPGSRSMATIASIERELPTIGLYTNSSRDFYSQSSALAEQVSRGAAQLVPPNSIDESLRQSMLRLPERVGRLQKGVGLTQEERVKQGLGLTQDQLKQFADKKGISIQQAAQEARFAGYTVQ